MENPKIFLLVVGFTLSMLLFLLLALGERERIRPEKDPSVTTNTQTETSRSQERAPSSQTETNNRPRERDQSDQSERDKLERDQSSLAYIVSQDAIKAQLAAPSTAKFPRYWDKNSVSVRPLGDSKYSVSAYVDAQNHYGAMLRKNYTAIIQFTGYSRYKVLKAEIY